MRRSCLPRRRLSFHTSLSPQLRLCIINTLEPLFSSPPPSYRYTTLPPTHPFHQNIRTGEQTKGASMQADPGLTIHIKADIKSTSCCCGGGHLTDQPLSVYGGETIEAREAAMASYRAGLAHASIHTDAWGHHSCLYSTSYVSTMPHLQTTPTVDSGIVH
ncbi:hypothetical protein LY78DRAFT_520 [Colletotrichum sublineola]|nr:hypothetical protein LY78DRAFT_520 [Colletotrichum sublineola]